MDDRITLSYVLTTYNKLPYLRVTIPYLLAACQPDEEIVVVDGGSQDGSAEYLAELHKSGK
ncbi:MAG TPA: glycosyltransferase, partial [Cyclobacteriaceae bacterium]|nr:glycosyltransferase [Cyclobacteriaceae bacterium]